LDKRRGQTVGRRRRCRRRLDWAHFGGAGYERAGPGAQGRHRGAVGEAGPARGRLLAPGQRPQPPIGVAPGGKPDHTGEERRGPSGYVAERLLGGSREKAPQQKNGSNRHRHLMGAVAPEQLVECQQVPVPPRLQFLEAPVAHHVFDAVYGLLDGGLRGLGPRRHGLEPLGLAFTYVLHKVLYAALAAAQVVDHVGPHDGPTDAGARPDGLVHVLDAGDPLVHEVQRLPPQRHRDPVGDEPGHHLLPEHHGHPAHVLHDPVDEVHRLLAGLLPGAQLDEGDEVHRVPRVSHDGPLRVALHVPGYLRHHQPRGAAGEHRIRRGQPVHLRVEWALDLQALVHGLHHVVRILDRLLQAGGG